MQAEKEMGKIEVWDDNLLEGVVFGIDLQVHYLASFCRSSMRHRFANHVSPSKSVGVWYKSISFVGTRGRRMVIEAGGSRASNRGRWQHRELRLSVYEFFLVEFYRKER